MNLISLIFQSIQKVCYFNSKSFHSEYKPTMFIIFRINHFKYFFNLKKTI